MFFFPYLFHPWMREEYEHAIFVHGCAMPWFIPRGALLIECREQKRCEHTFTRCQRGFHPSPKLDIGSQRQERNKSSHRFCPVSHAAAVRDSACSHLLRWHGHSLVSTHAVGKNLDYAAAVVRGSMHAFRPNLAHRRLMCKIRKRTPP